MERSYHARYYNGIDGIAYTVVITLFENTLEIQYDNAAHEHIREVWERGLMKQHSFTSSLLTLQYQTNNRIEQLEITDLEFLNQYHQLVKGRTMPRSWLRRGTLAWILTIIGGFFGLLLLIYFFMLPFIGDMIGKHIPKDVEINMGKQMYESMLAEEKIDVERTKNIQLFFNQLHVEGGYPVQITVVKQDIANAFALPGGGMVVYSKMLDQMDNYEQLAALLAHEYSHVQLKHATRGIFRNLSGYVFLSMLFSDANGIASILVHEANNLRNLSYSRELEHEADENGLLILTQNNIPKKGMKQLFELLKKEEHVEVNEIVSTHPDLDARIQFVDGYQQNKLSQRLPTDSMELYFHRLAKNNEGSFDE